MLNGCLVKGWAKTQPTVAQSTCEAEFIGANVGGKEALRHANMLNEIGMPVEGVFTWKQTRRPRLELRSARVLVS